MRKYRCSIFFGMCFQALLSAFLSKFEVITLSPEQQLIAGLFFLVVAFFA